MVFSLKLLVRPQINMMPDPDAHCAKNILNLRIKRSLAQLVQMQEYVSNFCFHMSGLENRHMYSTYVYCILCLVYTAASAPICALQARIHSDFWPVCLYLLSQTMEHFK